VSEDVDLSEAGDDRVGCLLRSGKAIERGGERGEVWAFEVGLLDFRREANHGETGFQQGLRDVDSEAAVGAGNEGSFSWHERQLHNWNSSRTQRTELLLKLIQWSRATFRA
jgi:hypothetical protein